MEKLFPNIRFFRNRSYRDITSFGIGSAPIPILAEMDTLRDLQDLLNYCHREKIATFLLGAGTNVAGMDTPFPGIIIRLNGEEFNALDIDGTRVTAGAFVKLPMLAATCAKQGLSGLSPLSGIPGSIGGAVHMNAGANGAEIGSMVEEIWGIEPTGKIYHANKNDICWIYRGNSIPNDVIITKVVLQLANGDAATEENAIQQELEHRRQREPQGRSAGCAFRNVSPLEPAGKLIDLCQMRNFRIGDVVVSTKHANYILNDGNGTEKDYLRMVATLRRAVSEKFGFYLRTEIVTINPHAAGLLELDTPAPRINLLYGGTSSERSISLQSGKTVCEALRHAGFSVELTDIKECRLTEQMRNASVVYPVLHGGFGENGDLQQLLEDAGIRFTGSGSISSRIIMNKIATKKLLDEIKLPTAPWAIVSKQNRRIPEKLHFPLMLKAPCEGSTVGIIKVNSPDEWDVALEKEFTYSDELLVEEFIAGNEITVPILNARAMPVIEIVSPTGFYDWDAKYVYKNGQTDYFCPPKFVPEEVQLLASEYALKFYHAARCRDILRVDFIVSNGVPYILEGNTIPGNTSHSLVPKSAAQAGISMEHLATDLVFAAMKRSTTPPQDLMLPEDMKSQEKGFFSRLFNGK